MFKTFNLCGLALLFVLISISFVYPQTSTEQLVITTYYPSPYGSYKDLDITNELRLNGTKFATNDANYNYIWSRGTAFQVVDNTGAVGLVTIYNNGGVIVGSPAGGNKGAGTINAGAVYDDNTLLTDYVFDKYFDGKIREDDLAKHSDYEMKTLDEMVAFIEENKHLPTMIGRKEWKRDGMPSLGSVVTQLWETLETQAIYIKELKEKISQLESKVSELKK